MRKFIIMMLLGTALSFAATSVSYAGEVDVLVDILVEKGILTRQEASVVKEETMRRVKKEVVEGESYELPGWVQKMKLKGDFRLRFQANKRQNDDEWRKRGRLRLRLGVDTKIASRVKVGFGLATGGSDPRSTNQTLQNFFDTPDIRLDYAFAKWSPDVAFLDDVSLIGGKFKRKDYLWAPTDLLWDGDINPEGGSIHLARSLADNIDSWVNTGVWILDENGKTDRPDPTLKYIQAGLGYKEGSLDSKVAATFYNFEELKDITLDNNAGSNTGAATGLVSNYDSIGFSGEVGIKKPFGGLPLDIDERIAFFGDFIHNLDDEVVKENLTGWAFGLKFGNNSVKEPGTWQIKYTKAILGKDAFPDVFPDSDRLNGETDVRSHEVAFKYALKKNVTFGIDYYVSRNFAQSSSGSDNRQHLVQADLVFKF